MRKIVQGLRVRKRSLLSALCFLTLLYAAVQFYIQDDYRPLQLLSSVENEASRLLKFISQPHVRCNDSLATGNSSRWLICLDSEIGVPSLRSDDQRSIVYSVGPHIDFSFEQILSFNFTTKLFIFCHEKCSKEKFHVNLNRASFYHSVIVPNDPADFSRNSFESQTLNTVIKTFHHENIHLLKLDTFIDSVQSFEVLKFLIDDSLLHSIQELHFVVKLDKLEEDFIYSWYRVLYALFTTAGFRLFHTSSSDTLCLQDTVMESCTYYLSWVKKPPPHVFVMYPPAIDGSRENEEDRLLSYLQNIKPKAISFTKIPLELAPADQSPKGQNEIVSLDLAATFLEKGPQPCHLIILRSADFPASKKVPFENGNSCETVSFAFDVQKDGSIVLHYISGLSLNSRKPKELDLTKIVALSKRTIIFIDIQENWKVMRYLSEMALPKHFDQMILRGSLIPTSGRFMQSVLRTRYSALQQLQEFSLSLVKVDQTTSEHLQFSRTVKDMYILNYVKNHVS